MELIGLSTPFEVSFILGGVAAQALTGFQSSSEWFPSLKVFRVLLLDNKDRGVNVLH